MNFPLGGTFTGSIDPGPVTRVSDQISRYIPPKGFFDPDDLAMMEHALKDAWTLIQSTDILALEKDEALRRAVCLKLFSVIRCKPVQSELLLDALLETLREDPAPPSSCEVT